MEWINFPITKKISKGNHKIHTSEEISGESLERDYRELRKKPIIPRLVN
jgi:hypothetical protein